MTENESVKKSYAGNVIADGGLIKALSINGVAATAQNMASGAYPRVKQRSFVYKGELTPQAKTFVAVVNSPEGAGIIQENGGAAVKRE